MARPRNKKGNAAEQATEQEVISAQSAQTKGEKKMSAFDELTELGAEEIASLLSDTRARGEYGDYLKQFIESEKVGIEVDFSDPLMVGKDAEKAKIGFENAKKATIKDTDPPQLKVPGAGAVKVVKKNTGTKDAPEFHLFLINTAKVAANA